MHRRWKKALAAIVALAAWAGPSWSVTIPTAAAQLQSFQIQLTDLDPGDGVVPLLGLADGYLSSGGDAPFFSSVPVSLLAGGSASGQSGAYAGVARIIAGDPAAAGQGPSAEVVIEGLGTTGVQLEAGLTRDAFVLSAHTSVTFSATARGRVVVTMPGIGHFAGANMSVSDAAPGLVVGAPSSPVALAGLAASGIPDVLDTGTQVLSLTITNPTDRALGGQLYINAFAGTFLMPIPEPGAWALLAAGLALLLPATRRRT